MTQGLIPDMKINFSKQSCNYKPAPGHGLGRSYALFLASQGAKVVVNDLGGKGNGAGKSEAPAQRVVEEIKASGGKAVANMESVAEVQGAQRIVEDAIKHFGSVEILINNAGITARQDLS